MPATDRSATLPLAAGKRLASPPARVVLGLVQINNSFSGQKCLPYAVALPQTYVQKMSVDPDRFAFLPPLYKRLRIADALKAADLVGFSTYFWNGRISLEIAIVFGGLHVPDQPEAFLRANPQIDVAVHNEGERTVLKLLEAFLDRAAWPAQPGVSLVTPDGRVVRNLRDRLGAQRGPAGRDHRKSPAAQRRAGAPAVRAARPRGSAGLRPAGLLTEGAQRRESGIAAAAAGRGRRPQQQGLR
jgi:hypothetical protein